MTSIIFEGLAPPEPMPPASGYGALNVRGFGFARSVSEVGAIGDGEFLLQQATEGPQPQPVGFCIGDGYLQLSAAYSFGAGIEPPATGDGVLELLGFGSWSAQVGMGALHLTGFGSELRQPPVDGPDVVLISSRLALALAKRVNESAYLADVLAVSPVMRGNWIGTRALRDVVAFEDALSITHYDLVQSVLAGGGDFSLTAIAVAQMVDALLLSGAVATELDAITLVTEAIAFGAMARSNPNVSFLSNLSASATVAQAYTAAERLVDELLASEALTAGALVLLVVRDQLSAGSDMQTALQASTIFRDGVDFLLRVKVGTNSEDEYVAWVMNTATKASSRYTNFPFNSFLSLAGRHYAVADTGIYRLGGDTDAGAPINARLRQGMAAYGSQVLKGFPAMYLGYTADGDLLLQVVTADPDTAEREAHAYRLKARAAQSAREGRAKVGRGLSSVYYDYVLENIDGADFVLESVEILPLVTRRRVRGNSSGRR